MRHSLAPAPANARTSAYAYLALLLPPAASSQGDSSALLEERMSTTVLAGTREGDAPKGPKFVLPFLKGICS